jgi:hypothetical protein
MEKQPVLHCNTVRAHSKNVPKKRREKKRRKQVSKAEID